jgi:hypothetical protein
MLCAERRDEKRQPLEPTEFEINSIVNNKEKVGDGAKSAERSLMVDAIAESEHCSARQ